MSNSGNVKVTTPTEREIALSRVFSAPRRRVFDALTQPGLLKHWFGGPPGWSLVACEIDLRVGGSFRYVWRGPEGTHIGMRGEYREVKPPERIVSTAVFDEAWFAGKAVGTAVLVEHEGKTALTTTVRYESREARDIVLKSPLERGVAAGYDRLAEFLTSALE